MADHLEMHLRSTPRCQAKGLSPGCRPRGRPHGDARVRENGSRNFSPAQARGALPREGSLRQMRAPERASRDKERTGRSGNLIARRGAETVAEFEKRLEAQRQSRANYDKQRGCRPSGHRINDRPVGGHFVIVDSEGILLKEEKIPATRTRGKETRLLQRTCLWMAGGVEGYENQILEDEAGLSSARIFEWLLSKPREFASRDPHGRQPTFAAFGASYDGPQIAADLPNSKLWELHTRKKWWLRKLGRRDEERQQSIVTWGQYAISGKPRKNVVVYRLRNPNRWWKLKKGKKVVDYVERIEIFDVIGFFQSSLLKAIENFPGLVTPEELEILSGARPTAVMSRGKTSATKCPDLSSIPLMS